MSYTIKHTACENELESIFSFHENIFNVGFDLESLEKRLETHPELLVYVETDDFVHRLRPFVPRR